MTGSSSPGMATSGSYDVSPTMPRIDGCPDDVCAATQLCLAPGDCYADQFVEPPARAISVRQPWAWAIIHGGKDVENRGRRDPWFGAIGERVWVHAAKTIEVYDFGEVRRLSGSHPPEDIAAGALIGHVVVRDVHHADTCFDRLLTYCSPWAQPGQWHVVIADPIALPEPILYRGALGLFSVERT